MAKHYFKKKLRGRRGFPVRIFIKKCRDGYVVEQFDGNNVKMLADSIEKKYKAVEVARDWEKYWERNGRGARIVDIT